VTPAHCNWLLCDWKLLFCTQDPHWASLLMVAVVEMWVPAGQVLTVVQATALVVLLYVTPRLHWRHTRLELVVALFRIKVPAWQFVIALQLAASVSLL
jgi:hypothetical protein